MQWLYTLEVLRQHWFWVQCVFAMPYRFWLYNEYCFHSYQGERSVQCWQWTSCLFLFSHSKCCCSSTPWRFPYIQFINTALCFLLMQTKWWHIHCCYVPEEFCCWIEQQWFASKCETKYFIQALSSIGVPGVPEDLIIKFSRQWNDKIKIVKQYGCAYCFILIMVALSTKD